MLRELRRASVEFVAGAALVAVGVLAQGHTDSAGQADRGLVAAGTVAVAIGGVLISWEASRILAARDSEDAVEAARAEVDEKLDSLSRVLGQAAGQISQAVEQVETNQINEHTAFALVSQANRMIYGQVNEIAVIRRSQFDSAYLLDTATTLDDLARQLSQPGSAAETSAVREKIAAVRATLSTPTSEVRSFPSELVDCPYCDARNYVRLGSLPGDTAAAVCLACNVQFNVHRAANGTPFARPNRDASGAARTRPTFARWAYECPSCGYTLSTQIDGRGERLVACLGCFCALKVDPVQHSVIRDGEFRRVETDAAVRNGIRPRVECPECGKAMTARLAGSAGSIALCLDDRVAIVVPWPG